MHKDLHMSKFFSIFALAMKKLRAIIGYLLGAVWAEHPEVKDKYKPENIHYNEWCSLYACG